MPRFVSVQRIDEQAPIAIAAWADGPWSRGVGLMGRRSIAPDEGLALVLPRPSRLGAAIHMIGVPFALHVAWVDPTGLVLDTALALPWRPHYAPRTASAIVLELHPSRASLVREGDRVRFVPLTDAPTSS